MDDYFFNEIKSHPAYRGTRTIAIPPCRRSFFFYHRTHRIRLRRTQKEVGKRCRPDTSTTTLSQGRDALRRVRSPPHISISHTEVVSARRAMYPRRPRRGASERGRATTCYDRGRGRTHGHRRQYEDACKRGPNKLRPSHQCTTHSTPMRRVRPGRYRARAARDSALPR